MSVQRNVYLMGRGRDRSLAALRIRGVGWGVLKCASHAYSTHICCLFIDKLLSIYVNSPKLTALLDV